MWSLGEAHRGLVFGNYRVPVLRPFQEKINVPKARNYLIKGKQTVFNRIPAAGVERQPPSTAILFRQSLEHLLRPAVWGITSTKYHVSVGCNTLQRALKSFL